ncbi:hypothetical protein FACS1894207_2500 [Bacteroidia bacterium]|nr:hypothetical protein FACS1894207_2500 [Bacteroidia bacterium]
MWNLSNGTNKLILFALAVCSQTGCCKSQAKQVDSQSEKIEEPVPQEDSIPQEVERLLLVYPAQIIGFENNNIVFADSSCLLFDDGKQKSTEELLRNPDLQDMFAYPYIKGKFDDPEKFQDAGRIRNDEFFKRIYGKTAAVVQKNLTTIVWCPKLVGQKLQITRVNGINEHLSAVSAELDEHPEWKDYLKSAGTFNWRVISGTNRLSTHSYGIAIDLNTKYSNYWQWDCYCKKENADLTYRNRIPQGIVDVFEKHGFIWGGKWYHYDTMHFEYRPELCRYPTVWQHYSDKKTARMSQ